MIFQGLLLCFGALWAKKRLCKCHLCACTYLVLEPAFISWISAPTSPRISPNIACVSTRETRLCDDPDSDTIATALLSLLIHNHPTHVFCAQHQSLTSPSTFKPKFVVVPLELEESLQPRQPHDPTSANTQHLIHLTDTVTLDCTSLGKPFIYDAMSLTSNPGRPIKL